MARKGRLVAYLVMQANGSLSVEDNLEVDEALLETFPAFPVVASIFSSS